MIIYKHTKSETKEKEYKIMKSAKSLARVHTHTHTHTHTSSLENIKINKEIKDSNIMPVSILNTG